MEQTEMILFTKDKLDKVLDTVGIKCPSDIRDPLINPNTGEVAVCEGCNNEITKENVGHIAHGSMEFYCKNPVCFGHFIAKKKLW